MNQSCLAVSRIVKPGVMPSLLADDDGPLPGRRPVGRVRGARNDGRRKRHPAGAIDVERAVWNLVDGVDVLGSLSQHLVTGLGEEILEALIREVGLVPRRVLHILCNRFLPDRVVVVELRRRRRHRQTGDGGGENRHRRAASPRSWRAQNRDRHIGSQKKLEEKIMPQPSRVRAASIRTTTNVGPCRRAPTPQLFSNCGSSMDAQLAATFPRS